MGGSAHAGEVVVSSQRRVEREYTQPALVRTENPTRSVRMLLEFAEARQDRGRFVSSRRSIDMQALVVRPSLPI